MRNASFHNHQITLKDLAARWKALPDNEKEKYVIETANVSKHVYLSRK